MPGNVYCVVADSIDLRDELFASLQSTTFKQPVYVYRLPPWARQYDTRNVETVAYLIAHYLTIAHDVSHFSQDAIVFIEEAPMSIVVCHRATVNMDDTVDEYVSQSMHHVQEFLYRLVVHNPMYANTNYIRLHKHCGKPKNVSFRVTDDLDNFDSARLVQMNFQTYDDFLQKISTIYEDINVYHLYGPAVTVDNVCTLLDIKRPMRNWLVRFFVAIWESIEDCMEDITSYPTNI